MTGKFINWDNGGGFGKDDWRIVYDLIRKYDIRSVIEYGCGLSTELFMAIGMEIVSLETVEKYADIPEANIIVAPYGKHPELGRKFDLAFIDGPGAYEFELRRELPDRRLSAEHAKRHAAHYVYMHDGGQGQPEVFDNDPAWEKIGGNDTGLIYRRKP